MSPNRELIAKWREHAAGIKARALREIEQATQAVEKAKQKLAQAAALREKAERAEKELDAQTVKVAACLPIPRVVETDAGAEPRPFIQQRARCAGHCGKVRYGSEQNAKRDMRRSGNKLRAYFSEACRCWHITKKVGGE